MKKLVIAATGLILAVLGIVAVAFRDPEPKVKAPSPKYGGPSISSFTVRNVQDYTVLISNESMDSRWRGSGVLLDPMTVLTCAHMIPKDKSTKTLWVYPYPGDRVVHAKLKFINYPRDLALLELSAPVTGHTTPVFAQKYELGEPIVSVGNIQGYMMWFASHGIVSGEHQRWVLTDAMVRGGNSGGPWANSRGEIVAITDVGWESDDGSAIAGGVPTQDLQRFMAQSRLKKPGMIYALTGE